MFKHNTLSFHTSLLILVAPYLNKNLNSDLSVLDYGPGTYRRPLSYTYKFPYKFNKSSSSTINYGINLRAYRARLFHCWRFSSVLFCALQARLTAQQNILLVDDGVFNCLWVISECLLHCKLAWFWFRMALY